MSSLAGYLQDKGAEVIGSDNSKYYFTNEELNKRKIVVLEYNKENIKDNYIYIIGLSISKENPEFKEILERDLEYYYYNDFIGEFIDKKMICVSGTHGKTTTSFILSQLSDISYIIGCGIGHYNNSDYLVLEACEYKNHYYSYTPELLVILNMDLDHPDFFKNKNDVIQSYQGMCDRSKIVLVNGDDELTKYLKHNNKYTFGIGKKCDFQIKILSSSEVGYTFLLKGNKICRLLKCNLLGIHNLYNYVAAYLSCILTNLNINHFKEVCLPKRRMSSYIYGNNILIDDYAHHPNEIKALYETVKLMYPNYKLKCIFQSHTYSRTMKFKREFKKVLSLFDDVYLLDVFSSSREKEEENKQKIVDKYFRKFKKYDEEVLKLINKNEYDVWIFLGAGTCNELLESIKNMKY